MFELTSYGFESTNKLNIFLSRFVHFKIFFHISVIININMQTTVIGHAENGTSHMHGYCPNCMHLCVCVSGETVAEIQ